MLPFINNDVAVWLAAGVFAPSREAATPSLLVAEFAVLSKGESVLPFM
jgi:hypothetical protein